MMINNLPNTHFTANWSSPIHHLNPATYSLARRLNDFIKSAVFFVPNFFLEKITRSLIYPASSYLFKKKVSNQAIQEFNAINDPSDVILKTPDGVEPVSYTHLTLPTKA